MHTNFSIKRLPFTLVLILATLAVSYWVVIYNSVSEVTANATYNYPRNFDELEQSSSIILIGTPTQDFQKREHKINYFESGDIKDFYTLTEIKVEKVLKQPQGSTLVDSQMIKIAEPISLEQTIMGKFKLTVDNYQELQKSSKYLLFITINDHGKYWLRGGFLGKYNLDHTDTTDKQNEKKIKFKEDISKKYQLTL